MAENGFDSPNAGLPKISGRNSVGGANFRSSDAISKFNRSFMNSTNTEGKLPSPSFAPPNITAFRKAELGEKGSLFQA